jgi:GTP cyclohydrolase I
MNVMNDLKRVETTTIPFARPVDQARLARAVREVLLALGEDPDRPGLAETPTRVSKALVEMTAGLRADPRLHLRKVFPEAHGELVLVRQLEFSSLCEHHLLPFTGHAHIAYLPTSRGVVGLSKLARALDDVARRPQVQERLGHDLAQAIDDELAPRGVVVILEAAHQCMSLRGARKHGSTTTTIAARGEFNEPARRAEVLALIRAGQEGR